MRRPEWEPVIGLEVHVQLRTASKMFCADAAEFGAPPNSRVCPVCLGLPGALPAVNERAVELAVRAALGLGCDVNARSAFARKSYFYPDLPKGYQITQHAEPLATGGSLELPSGDGSGTRRIRIRRLHLEEDTGKLLHDRIPGATAIDLNRAGVPLIEIVTEPDLRSPEDARALLTRLKQALQYLDVSDCNMEQGSLRVDANVSVRGPGEPLGTRTELKNLNSFGNLERALHFEVHRQREVRAAMGRIEHQTLLWDAARGEARPVRAKEETHDYRYFPEPDLPPLVLSPEWVAGLRNEIPEMPWERAERLRIDHGLAPAHAQALCATRPLADYFEAVVHDGAEPRDAASWVLGEVLAEINRGAGSVEQFAVRPEDLAALLRLSRSGGLSRPAARRIFARMIDTGEAAERALRALGLDLRRDAAETEGWVEEVLHANPGEVRRFREGDGRLMGFLVGEVMRLSRGTADPRQVSAVLRRRLGS